MAKTAPAGYYCTIELDLIGARAIVAADTVTVSIEDGKAQAGSGVYAYGIAIDRARVYQRIGEIIVDTPVCFLREIVRRDIDDHLFIGR